MITSITLLFNIKIIASSLFQTLLHIDVFDHGLIVVFLIVAFFILVLLLYTLFTQKRSAKKLITEVNATRVELVEKKEIQKTLFQGSVDPIVIFDTRNNVVDFNKAAEKYFGYNFFRLIGKKFPANESFDQKFPEWMKIFKNGEGISGFNTIIKLHSGKLVPVSISISPIFNIKDELTYLFYWYRDISKDYEFQKALQQSEESYKTLFDNVNDAILVLRKNDRRIVDANKQAFIMYGYNYVELINSTLGVLSMFVFDEYRLLDEIISGKIKFGESTHKKKDGTKIYIEFNASIVNYNNEDVIIMVTRDITERKNYEYQLQKSVKEKEVLLREIHHRVKNNLQLITSLLDLQIGNTNDIESKKAFLESQNRIRVMSIVYERLYESTDMHTIDTQNFVKKIISYLYDVYNGSEKNIHINYELDKFPIDIQTAVPVSLIICELVTNALKYGFPESSYSNTIDVKYLANGSGMTENVPYTLSVKDSGGMFPKDLQPDKSSTLGLQLVYILAAQLKGKVTYDFIRGTEFKIEFKGI